MATHAVAGVPVADEAGTRWLSANPDKAWGERFFLAYSPIWMIAFGVYQRTRVGDRLGDLGNLLVTLAIFAPAWVVPAMLHAPTTRRWYEAYWFKFNVWILVYSADRDVLPDRILLRRPRHGLQLPESALDVRFGAGRLRKAGRAGHHVPPRPLLLPDLPHDGGCRNAPGAHVVLE